MRRACKVFVALTAVFLLHGVPPRTDEVAMTALIPLGPAASDGHHSPSVAELDASPMASDPIDRGPAGTQQPRPSSGHLWAACLAVLSAGLALLVALLLRPGTPTGRSRFRARAQRWTSGPALLRPPDLFLLCVLRN